MDASYYKEKYEPINGKWYIKELLGEGSYGKVFRIEYKDVLGKTTEAALKVITIPQSEKEIDSVRETLQDDNSVNQYFTNMASKIADEFNVMAQLKGNTNIVSYEEHDIFPHENGIGYDILIRMELLTPLNKLTENISEQEVIKLGIDICKALEVCQKHNIVHRDIKPENIFVSPMGDYKLGDFGVAKTMKHEMTVMTVTGTYVYMAPELKKGEECGTNVDIYSLGMVMYKLLNFNREPFLPLPPEMFTFEQREEALINRMKGMLLPKPANANERLAEIILKACEYNQKTRYESPIQMRMELESLLVKAPLETPADIPEQTDDVLTDDSSELDETLGLFGKTDDKEKDLDGTRGLFDAPQNADIKKTKLSFFVENCLSEKLKNDKCFYFVNSVDFDIKLATAMDVYANISEDETPLFIYDSSMKKSGKSGFVVTDKKIYISKGIQNSQTVIPLKTINSICLIIGGIYIYYDDKEIALTISSDSNRWDIEKNVLIAEEYAKLIINLIKHLYNKEVPFITSGKKNNDEVATSDLGNLDETVGIFDNNAKNKTDRDYNVIILKTSKLPLAFDILVDGIITATNVKSQSISVSLSGGEHVVTIQLCNLTAYEKKIQKTHLNEKQQNQYDNAKKLSSVSVNVCEETKISFESDLKLFGNEPALKILSVESLQTTATEKDTDYSDDIKETYPVAINRKDQFYAKGLYGPNGYAVEIFVDGVSVAKDITEDYILDLTKGEHFVEIGVCSNSNLISGIASMLKKAKFTASNRGEICYGFDRVWGGLKIFSMKGSLRK